MAKAAVKEAADPVEEQVKEPVASQNGSSMVHHVVRTIARDAPRGGAMSLEDIEAYLHTYLSTGWELLNAFYLGEMPEGYAMMWVLVKK